MGGGMTDKELFKLALEALEELRLYPETPEYFKRSKAITALKERLLEASMREVQRLGQEIEQEPVAWMSASRFGELQKGVSVITTLTKQRAFEDDVAIHTHPPQRTKQKPAAWIHIDPNKPKVKFLEWKENEHGYRGTWIKKPLYLHPAQRTWVGLTDDDKQIAFDDTQEGGGFWEFADAIEAKLKEKNNG